MNIRDFINELGFPEFKSIIGKWGSKIFFLILISFISLIAMGLANGSLVYLEKKMNNPWMQFVDVKHLMLGGVEKGNNEKYPIFDFKAAKNYQANNLDKVKECFQSYVKTVYFLNIETKAASSEEGFVMKTNNPFYKELVQKVDIDKKKFVITNNNTFRDDNWGIIVTESFLKSLGLTNKDPYISIGLNADSNSDKKNLIIPICAVVKSLRNSKEFIMSEQLYKLLYGASERINEVHSDSIQKVARWFLPHQHVITSELKDKGVWVEKISSVASKPHIAGIFLATNDFELDLSNEKAIRIFDLNVMDLNLEAVNSSPATYTLMFKNPDDVLIFAKHLKKDYGIKLEESRMEAKRNFSFFKHLSQVLSYALIGFSIIAIIFFILNLLLSHINKNKRNLGTLKAFGLPNKNIIILYSSITLLLVSISFMSAFILSELLGDPLLNLYIHINNISSENYITKVAFKNNGFLYTLAWFVIVPTILIVFKLFLYLYKVTPGDLIYERK